MTEKLYTEADVRKAIAFGNSWKSHTKEECDNFLSTLTPQSAPVQPVDPENHPDFSKFEEDHLGVVSMPAEPQPPSDAATRPEPWCCYVDPATTQSCRQRAIIQIEHAPWGPCDNTQSCGKHVPMLLPDECVEVWVTPIEKSQQPGELPMRIAEEVRKLIKIILPDMPSELRMPIKHHIAAIIQPHLTPVQGDILQKLHDEAWMHAACLTIAETGQKWGESVKPSAAMQAVYDLYHKTPVQGEPVAWMVHIKSTGFKYVKTTSDIPAAIKATDVEMMPLYLAHPVSPDIAKLTAERDNADRANQQNEERLTEEIEKLTAERDGLKRNNATLKQGMEVLAKERDAAREELKGLTELVELSREVYNEIDGDDTTEEMRELVIRWGKALDSTTPPQPSDQPAT